MEPDAGVITIVEETDQAQEISMMTRSRIVTSEEEIKEWQSAQEEDPVVRDTIERVRQRQERNAFAPTPQGLLMQEQKSHRRLVVPVSLRQKVLASCHDEPTKGHTRIRRTQELARRRY